MMWQRPYGYVLLIILMIGLFMLINLMLSKESDDVPTRNIVDALTSHVESQKVQHSHLDTNLNVVDWNERFRFVPNNVQKCDDLLGGIKDLPDSFIAKFKQFRNDFEDICNNLGGTKEGYTAQVENAFMIYQELASHRSVRTICETGFNGGHSTFGWLTINPFAHVYTFDIGSHTYAKPMAAHIQNLYPDRLNITWGDSTKTMPLFRRDNPSVKCDLIIIDGGHTTEICKSDLLNFKDMASDVNVVIMDNYPQDSYKFKKKLGDCWEWAKRNGGVFEVFNCHAPNNDPKGPDFGFSVGRFPIE